jgi:hypothetical protein
VWLYQRDQQTNPFCPFHQRHKQVIAKPTSFVPFIARWSPQAARPRAGQAFKILSWFVSTLIPFHYFPSPDTFFISSDTYARKTAPHDALRYSQPNPNVDRQGPTYPYSRANLARVCRSRPIDARAGHQLGAVRVQGEYLCATKMLDSNALTETGPHFQAMQGFFRQSDPSLVAFSPQQVLESEFGLLETDDERWDMFKTEIKGEWGFPSRQRSTSHIS